jgi:DNA-binding MarR family transcriptional regulator
MTANQSNYSTFDKIERSMVDLNNVYRKHAAYIKAKYNVSSLEMEILQYIILEGPKKMKEIGKHFKIKLSTLTSIIDKIERQRLVKRVNSREDRRVVFLEISRKGLRLYNDYSSYMKIVSQSMQERMNQNQYDSFLNVIEKVSELSYSR